MSKEETKISPIDAIKNLPDGIYIFGTVLKTSEKRGNAKATGKPYVMVSYMVMCGADIVNVSQSNAENAPIHQKGQRVSIEIEAGWKDNGVIVLNGDVKMA